MGSLDESVVHSSNLKPDLAKATRQACTTFKSGLEDNPIFEVAVLRQVALPLTINGASVRVNDVLILEYERFGS